MGTPTPQGKLHIKGSENISQLIVEASNPQSNTQPLLKFIRFSSEVLRLHSDNDENVFLGYQAGQANNLTFSINSGTENTFIGSRVGQANTSGYSNTSLGYSGLRGNTTGTSNTAVGSVSLYSNVDGDFNTATGVRALFANNGNYNTALGYNALANTTASEFNTALGSQAGDGFDNGYNNVFVGANTDVNAAGLFNVIAIGQGTIVGASSTARFGNAATSSYGGWANWSNVSDGRFKKDIQENVPGLSFITKLRPVTYHLKAGALDGFLRRDVNKSLSNEAATIQATALAEKEKIVYSGFIAQEVEAAAKELGFDFSGVDAPRNGNETYALRYAEFVVPLVKAVQEQQAQIEALKKENETLKQQQKELALLKQQVAALMQKIKQVIE